MSSDVEWRWADPTGQQRLVREDELRAALASGVIPPNAPVWKDGLKDWQPAYSVPELTTSALAAANGVVQNIPPPPLGVLGAQKDMEKEGAALNMAGLKSEPRGEPPPPPRYVPAATRVSLLPPSPSSSRQMAAVRESNKNLPTSRESAKQIPADQPSAPSPAAPTAPSADATMQAPTSNGKLVAEESNTGVKLPAVNDATASQLLGDIDETKPLPFPPVQIPHKEEPKKALPTTIGVPALPESTLAAAASATAPTARATTASSPPRSPTMPPPLPPRTSKPPPPPAAKKNKTLILYGGAPDPAPGPLADSRQAPPINVPAPSGGQSPQAITRPPPADGFAHVSDAPPAVTSNGTPAPPDALPVEELSQSILVEDRDDLDDADTDSVILSDSVRRVSSTLPPKPPAVRSGTLLGFPVPTVPPAAEHIPRPPRVPGDVPLIHDTAPGGTHDAMMTTSPPPASGRVVHDLRQLLDTPRPKFFWPVVGAVGAVAVFGLLAIAVGVTHKSDDDSGKKPSAKIDDGKVATTDSTGSATSPASSGSSGASGAPSPASSMATADSLAASGTTASTSLPLATTGCALAGTSHTIAPRALVPTGVEVQAHGAGIGLGFATAPKDAMTVEVEPTSLTVGASARVHLGDALKRVVPESANGKLAVDGEGDRRGDRIASRRVVPGPWPVDIGVADGNIVWAPHLKDNVSKLWPIDADAPVEALRGVPIESKGEKGFAVTFRKGGAIWMGAALGDRTLTARGPLFRIMGLGPQIGSPTIASSGESILIAWADRATAQDPWGLRWVKFTPGEAPHDAVAFHPPAGGLGEHAMSPWLASVGGGRFLFTWTEGPVSAHQVRGQTLNVEGAPVGDAFVVSADGVNAGQAQGAVLADGRGVVAFLAAKAKAYEVVATPVVCAAAK